MLIVDVSVIIVNYKTVNLILDCIRSIYEQTEGVSYEVIVVDNNSEDGFQERIQDCFPKVVCLPLSENIGFGRANNEGLKIARGRNIFFLNPDTLLLNNSVKYLSDYLDAHPNVGVCGGNLYDVEMRPMHSYRMYLPGILWELNDLLGGNLVDKLLWGKNRQFNHTGKSRSVGYITGADMMVRREVLDKVGCFSPRFFMYYEETELTYRIKKAGYKVVSVPQAKIQHLEGKSFKPGINVSRIRYSIEGRNTYYSLHYPYSYRVVIELIVRVSVMCRILIFSLLREQDKRKYYQTVSRLLPEKQVI